LILNHKLKTMRSEECHDLLKDTLLREHAYWVRQMTYDVSNRTQDDVLTHNLNLLFDKDGKAVIVTVISDSCESFARIRFTNATQVW
jgi:hypothetical protein